MVKRTHLNVKLYSKSLSCYTVFDYLFGNKSSCNNTEIWICRDCCLHFWSFVFLLSFVVLYCYSGWFVGLMFKRQQNQSPCGKSVTVTETVFTKGRLLNILWKSAILKLIKIQQAFCRRWPLRDGLTAGCVLHVTLYWFIKECNSWTYVTGSREWRRIKVRYIVIDSIQMFWFIV